MKTAFFSVLLVLASFSVWGTCTTKINPSKVMLFIDTNFSDLEIATAQKAACKRGERLEVIPKNYKEYSSILKAQEKTEEEYDKCSDAKEERDCSKEEALFYSADEMVSEFKKKQVPIEEQIAKRLEELDKEKVKLTNLSISGHNGGGSFGGSKGDFGRRKLVEMITKYPEMNQVESLLLLGCYTGVKHEVAAWKAMFPKVSIIAGYDGSAPLSKRPYGHTYIEDILTKEKELRALSDEKKINSEAKKLITDLEKINAAVYLKTACAGTENEFYYASLEKRQFDHLKLKECDVILGQIAVLKPAFQKYMSGEIEPPKNTVSGDLRKMYDKARSAEHCMGNSGSSEVTPNSVFNLLFWDGVKKNFADFYKDDLQETAKIVETINSEDVQKNVAKLRDGLIAEKELEEKKLKLFTEDFQGYKKKFEDEVAEVEEKLKKVNASEEYQSLMQRWSIGDYQNFTKDEKVLFDSPQFIARMITRKKNALDDLITYPETTKKQIQSSIDYSTAAITQRNDYISKLKTNPEILKKVFIPNTATMMKKTRKEIIENTHNVHALLYAGGLSPKQAGALNWFKTVSVNHLEHFANPFSWHEATGRPEKPENADALKSYLPKGDK